MDAPLQGDSGGHTGTAPTNLRYTFTHTSGAEMHRALPPPLLKIKKCVYRYDFIVAVQRGNNICVGLSSPCSAGTIFLRFIVAVQRGNNIYAVLSSPLGAETIFVPFYRHRSARKQYLCCFIVAVQRGNDIFAFQCLQRYCKH